MSNLIQTADTGDGVRVLTLNNPPVNALSYAAWTPEIRTK